MTQIARIKRGAHFRAAIVLDEAEWAALWPWEEILAEAALISGRHALDIAVTEAERSIRLSAATSGWPPGPASFDLRILKDGQIIALPPTRNVAFEIIEGATR